MTKATRRQRFLNQWARVHASAETTFTAALADFFQVQAKTVLGELRRHGAPPASVDAIFRPAEWNEPLKLLARKQVERAALAGARLEWDHVTSGRRSLVKTRPVVPSVHDGSMTPEERDAERMPLPPEVRDAVNRLVDETMDEPYWDKISDTVRDDIADALQEGIEAGDSGPDIAKRIDAALGDGGERGITIARTECTNSLNGGQQAQRDRLENLGVISGKEWASLDDDLVRPDHEDANSQVVGNQEQFNVGGYLCDFPGDTSLPGDQRINCRCCSMAVLTESEEG